MDDIPLPPSPSTSSSPPTPSPPPPPPVRAPQAAGKGPADGPDGADRYSPSMVTSDDDELCAASETTVETAPASGTILPPPPQPPLPPSPAALESPAAPSAAAAAVLGKDKAKQRLKAFAALKSGSSVSFGIQGGRRKLLPKVATVVDEDDDDDDVRRGKMGEAADKSADQGAHRQPFMDAFEKSMAMAKVISSVVLQQQSEEQQQQILLQQQQQQESKSEQALLDKQEEQKRLLSRFDRMGFLKSASAEALLEEQQGTGGGKKDGGSGRSSRKRGRRSSSRSPSPGSTRPGKRDNSGKKAGPSEAAVPSSWQEMREQGVEICQVRKIKERSSGRGSRTKGTNLTVDVRRAGTSPPPSSARPKVGNDPPVDLVARESEAAFIELLSRSSATTTKKRTLLDCDDDKFKEFPKAGFKKTQVSPSLQWSFNPKFDPCVLKGRDHYLKDGGGGDGCLGGVHHEHLEAFLGLAGGDVRRPGPDQVQLGARPSGWYDSQDKFLAESLASAGAVSEDPPVAPEGPEDHDLRPLEPEKVEKRHRKASKKAQKESKKKRKDTKKAKKKKKAKEEDKAGRASSKGTLAAVKFGAVDDWEDDPQKLLLQLEAGRPSILPLLKCHHPESSKAAKKPPKSDERSRDNKTASSRRGPPRSASPSPPIGKACTPRGPPGEGREARLLLDREQLGPKDEDLRVHLDKKISLRNSARAEKAAGDDARNSKNARQEKVRQDETPAVVARASSPQLPDHHRSRRQGPRTPSPPVSPPPSKKTPSSSTSSRSHQVGPPPSSPSAAGPIDPSRSRFDDDEDHRHRHHQIRTKHGQDRRSSPHSDSQPDPGCGPDLRLHRGQGGKGSPRADDGNQPKDDKDDDTLTTPFDPEPAGGPQGSSGGGGPQPLSSSSLDKDRGGHHRMTSRNLSRSSRSRSRSREGSLRRSKARRTGGDQSPRLSPPRRSPSFGGSRQDLRKGSPTRISQTSRTSGDNQTFQRQSLRDHRELHHHHHHQAEDQVVEQRHRRGREDNSRRGWSGSPPPAPHHHHHHHDHQQQLVGGRHRRDSPDLSPRHRYPEQHVSDDDREQRRERRKPPSTGEDFQAPRGQDRRSPASARFLGSAPADPPDAGHADDDRSGGPGRRPATGRPPPSPTYDRGEVSPPRYRDRQRRYDDDLPDRPDDRHHDRYRMRGDSPQFEDDLHHQPHHRHQHHRGHKRQRSSSPPRDTEHDRGHHHHRQELLLHRHGPGDRLPSSSGSPGPRHDGGSLYEDPGPSSPPPQPPTKRASADRSFEMDPRSESRSRSKYGRVVDGEDGPTSPYYHRRQHERRYPRDFPGHHDGHRGHYGGYGSHHDSSAERDQDDNHGFRQRPYAGQVEDHGGHQHHHHPHEMRAPPLHKAAHHPPPPAFRNQPPPPPPYYVGGELKGHPFMVSPKRISLDERLERELGIKVSDQASLAAPALPDYSQPPPGYLPNGQKIAASISTAGPRVSPRPFMPGHLVHTESGRDMVGPEANSINLIKQHHPPTSSGAPADHQGTGVVPRWPPPAFDQQQQYHAPSMVVSPLLGPPPTVPPHLHQEDIIVAPGISEGFKYDSAPPAAQVPCSAAPGGPQTHHRKEEQRLVRVGNMLQIVPEDEESASAEAPLPDSPRARLHKRGPPSDSKAETGRNVSPSSYPTPHKKAGLAPPVPILQGGEMQPHPPNALPGAVVLAVPAASPLAQRENESRAKALLLKVEEMKRIKEAERRQRREHRMAERLKHREEALAQQQGQPVVDQPEGAPKGEADGNHPGEDVGEEAGMEDGEKLDAEEARILAEAITTVPEIDEPEDHTVDYSKELVDPQAMSAEALEQEAILRRKGKGKHDVRYISLKPLSKKERKRQQRLAMAAMAQNSGGDQHHGPAGDLAAAAEAAPEEPAAAAAEDDVDEVEFVPRSPVPLPDASTCKPILVQLGFSLSKKEKKVLRYADGVLPGQGSPDHSDESPPQTPLQQLSAGFSDNRPKRRRRRLLLKIIQKVRRTGSSDEEGSDDNGQGQSSSKGSLQRSQPKKAAKLKPPPPPPPGSPPLWHSQEFINAFAYKGPPIQFPMQRKRPTSLAEEVRQ